MAHCGSSHRLDFPRRGDPAVAPARLMAARGHDDDVAVALGVPRLARLAEGRITRQQLHALGKLDRRFTRQHAGGRGREIVVTAAPTRLVLRRQRQRPAYLDKRSQAGGAAVPGIHVQRDERRRAKQQRPVDGFTWHAAGADAVVKNVPVQQFLNALRRNRLRDVLPLAVGVLTGILPAVGAAASASERGRRSEVAHLHAVARFHAPATVDVPAQNVPVLDRRR